MRGNESGYLLLARAGFRARFRRRKPTLTTSILAKMTLPAFQTAARYYGPNDLRVEAVALQPPQPNAVTVAIAACGICGSDLHHVAGGPPGNAEDFIEPISGERGPCVLGHEFSGTVVALGTDVARLVAEKKCNLALGTRVVAEAMWYCGECVECMQGITNMCRNGQYVFFPSDTSLLPVGADVQS